MESLLRTAFDVVYVLDGEGRYLDVLTYNSKLLQRQAEEIKGKRLDDLHPLPVAEQILTTVREALRSGEGQVLEYPLDLISGARWFEGRATPFPESGSEHTRVLWIAHDITSRKQAEESLRRAYEDLEGRVRQRTAELAQANARLRCEAVERRRNEEVARERENRYGILYENSPLSLWEQDWSGVQAYLESLRELGVRDLSQYLRTHTEAVRHCAELIKVRDANQAALTLLETSHKAHLLHDIFQTFTEERLQSFGEELVAILEGQRHFCCETTLRTLTGKIIPVAVYTGITPGCEKTLQRVLVSMLDMTERKFAEQRVQREQRLLKQVLETYERHRQLTAYEIHDGVAQPLTAALMSFEGVLERLNRQHPEWIPGGLERSIEWLRDGLNATRRLMSGLRPPVLDELGIVAALESLASEGEISPPITCRFDVQFDRLAPPLETAIFRIVQEILLNAQQHSRSERIELTLVQQADRLQIRVEDWGIGFDPSRIAPEHFGLEGLRKRAELFGGEVVIDSRPGGGARILVTLPVIARPEHDA